MIKSNLSSEGAKEEGKVKKPLSLAWFVIMGPLSIVVFLSIFEGPPWIAEQSAQGAKGEAMTNNSRGLTAMKENRYRDATGYFAKALKIKPDHPDSYMNMGILYNLMGDYERAIAYFQKCLALGPEQKELVYNNLGMVYARKGDLAPALSMFQKALKIDIKPASVYRNIGNLCIAQNDWEGAVQAFRNTIANRPTLLRLYVDVLNETLSKYEGDECCEVLKARLARGITPEDLAQYDSVIVNEVCENDPQLAEDYKNLGVAYTKLDSIYEAISSYREALRIKPDYAAVHNKLGILYARSGDLERALSSFQEAVGYDPNFEEARDNLELCRRKLRQMSEKPPDGAGEMSDER